MQNDTVLRNVILQPAQHITCPPEIVFLAKKQTLFIGPEKEDKRMLFYPMDYEKRLTDSIEKSIALTPELAQIEHHYNIIGFYLADPGNGESEKRVDCEIICFPTLQKAIVVTARPE